MKNKNLNIGDISRSIGYTDPLYFSRLFKKIKGHTPTAFRKKI
ncbi:MAG: helix-turn-helix domain-containing protein [Halanaerobiales bacterium]